MKMLTDKQYEEALSGASEEGFHRGYKKGYENGYKIGNEVGMKADREGVHFTSHGLYRFKDGVSTPITLSEEVQK